MDYQQLYEHLSSYGQEHLLDFWPRLDEQSRQRLTQQLSSINWEMMHECIKNYIQEPPITELPPDLQPAPSFPSEPEDEEQEAFYEAAEEEGCDLIADGKVAGFTVAGGQGTRLGHNAPKGTLPISPVRNKSLFQLFAEGVVRTQEKYCTEIPWYIMTSPANDEPTRLFFQENDYFGLDPDNVMFLTQGMLPAISLDGKLLLSAPDSLALSPDGHGGCLKALKESGALADMGQRGIEHISYWQVDNPLVHMFDPLFIGLHARMEAEMSCRGLIKNDPLEKLGNFCLIDDRVTVIEYSDMPEDLARMTDESGELVFRVGSPAIHLFQLSFVEKLTGDNELTLPFHRAVKKVPYLDDRGRLIEPNEPNAVKLETFIFDALPLAEEVVILEVDRQEQFAPVKQKTGTDSIESCHRLMNERAARWLEEAGVPVPRKQDGSVNCTIELSPRDFVDPEDVRDNVSKIKPPQPEEENYISLEN